MAHVNRKEYWIIFVALFVLTILEVAVCKVPGISKNLLVISLVSMAAVKAALVGLFYMHLRYETNILKLTVLIPMLMPVLYAVVLISEAAYRLL